MNCGSVSRLQPGGRPVTSWAAELEPPPRAMCQSAGPNNQAAITPTISKATINTLFCILVNREINRPPPILISHLFRFLTASPNNRIVTLACPGVNYRLEKGQKQILGTNRPHCLTGANRKTTGEAGRVTVPGPGTVRTGYCRPGRSIAGVAGRLLALRGIADTSHLLWVA